MESFANLLFEIRDNVAFVTLNRPQAANAFNVDLARDLAYAAMRCDEDRAVRAVLIRGAGAMFCGGGDVKGFAAQGDGVARHIKEITTYLHAAVSRLVRMDAPCVAAVHGSAAGAGMSLACAADFVLAGASARFTMAYTRIGLSPDGSSTYFLPRIVGLKRAIELALTNRVLSASEALALGIVTTVVPDGQLNEEAEKLARSLAAGPTAAFGATRRLMHSGFNETLETQMELETRSIATLSATEDGREGVRAFVEKRAPKYQGS
jgi:2-(1,2-epoxy-1,2-dihydrophenyl)acetyl-CoA isomerase